MPDTMRAFGNFNVRILRQHDRYGLEDCLVHNEEEPVVEFYDNRHVNDGDWKRGQFVARYYAETLREDCVRIYLNGLQLNGDIPSWHIHPVDIGPIFRWLRQELPQFRLTAKQLSDLKLFRACYYGLEADRIQNGLARALIRAVRNEGHGTCWLGTFNTDKPGLAEYRHGRICNFSCDFVIPRYDEKIQQELLKYHNTRRFQAVQTVIERLPLLHGYSVFWS